MEHRNLGKLVGLLDRLPVDMTDPKLDEITLLVDVLRLPDLLSRCPSSPGRRPDCRQSPRANALSADIADEIERQHCVLARQGTDLMRDPRVGCARGNPLRGTPLWSAPGYTLNAFATTWRSKSSPFFPVAEQRLGDADWHAIAAVLTPEPADPLFVSLTEKRFVEPAPSDRHRSRL
ncbi:hypothetical protein [Candidatus Accumulibacter sp. ACC012]|uniref:hypothetical protein n=1 Tax=Candidatus Accumulibacter sp. ACC012 TaxID=2823332 RepID=UPI0025BE9362|nr:hypothetical protein [Candidatus Accumulibacter sp. ACC012]